MSILEDGWTQPIVATLGGEIVDGFHRWTVSDSKELVNITQGMVPVVYLRSKDEHSQRMATIRHNRARGSHAVLKMSEILTEMVKAGKSMEELCSRLGMEPEEVIRLASRHGIPRSAIIRNAQWSDGWMPD